MTSTVHPDRVDERKFSRARALSKKVGVCARTLRRWADAGHIRRYKVNGHVVLFDESEVLDFIQRGDVCQRADKIDPLTSM